MGYKKKSWLSESQEAPYLVLEKNIYKNLNVSTIGYVVAQDDDERFNNKVKKYTVKAGPIVGSNPVENYTLYNVACVEGVTITQEEINSGMCIVVVLFLDTNPNNLYKSVHSYNTKIEDKLKTDSGVENIMHDYRNGVIIAKLKIQ